MALNLVPRRRFGVAIGMVLTGVTAGLIGFAGTATAHTPYVKAECKGETTTLTVKLKDYQGSKRADNTVTITGAGAKDVPTTKFQTKWETKIELPGDVNYNFKVVVTAWDDAKWSFTKELPVAACVTPPPSSSSSSSTPPSSSSSVTTPPSSSTTTTTTTTTTVSVPQSSATVPPAPTTTTTTAQVKEAALAETGASIGLPLGIAAVLLVGGGVLLFVVRRRSKA